MTGILALPNNLKRTAKVEYHTTLAVLFNYSTLTKNFTNCKKTLIL